MVRAYKEDSHPEKVNLSIGGYLNAETKETHLFKAVQQAEKELADDPASHHGYLPTLGYPDVNKAALKLLLGDDHPALKGKSPIIKIPQFQYHIIRVIQMTYIVFFICL